MNVRSIGAKPVGFVGRIAGRLMNCVHSHQYREIICSIDFDKDENGAGILDVGCGGGIALKHFASCYRRVKLYGIDPSCDMVALSSRLNRTSIVSGRMTILNNSVENIGIEDKSIDLLSVFDNINFWNDYERAFTELRRVLKDDGRILIVNGFPEIGSKWYDFVKFKSVDDYDQLLAKNGFAIAKCQVSKHTIVIDGVPS